MSFDQAVIKNIKNRTSMSRSIEKDINNFERINIVPITKLSTTIPNKQIEITTNNQIYKKSSYTHVTKIACNMFEKTTNKKKSIKPLIQPKEKINSVTQDSKGSK